MKSISLPGFKDLVDALEEIAKGRYMSSCFEKKARAYTGQVLIAQEALEKFKANMLKWTNGMGGAEQVDSREGGDASARVPTPARGTDSAS